MSKRSLHSKRPYKLTISNAAGVTTADFQSFADMVSAVIGLIVKGAPFRVEVELYIVRQDANEVTECAQTWLSHAGGRLL